MTRKENYLRAAGFERPDYIPMIFAINSASWDSYPQEFLCEQILAHPMLFGGAQPPELPFVQEYANVARKDEPYVDDFHCRWETTVNGITGTVVGHPLADWADFAKYTPRTPTSAAASVPWTGRRFGQPTMPPPTSFTWVGCATVTPFCSCATSGGMILILD